MKHGYTEAAGETLCGIDLRDARFDPPVAGPADELVDLDRDSHEFQQGGIDAVWALYESIDCEPCKEKLEG